MNSYIFFSKLWHEGSDRFSDPPPVPLDPQPDWEPPKYRPGWTVKYRLAPGPTIFTGRVRYALRDKPDGVTFYRVEREDGTLDVAFDCSIKERVLTTE